MAMSFVPAATKEKMTTKIPKHCESNPKNNIHMYNTKNNNVKKDDNCFTHGSGAGDSHMQVMVHTINNKTITIDVEPSDEVRNIKYKIEEKSGIPKDFQKLMFSGKEMKNEETINYYDIKHGDTIRMVWGLLGGMFAAPGQWTEENIKSTLSEWSAKLTELQKDNDNLKAQLRDANTNPSRGLRKVVQNGSKDLVPKKYECILKSGSFKSWSRDF